MHLKIKDSQQAPQLPFVWFGNSWIFISLALHARAPLSSNPFGIFFYELRIRRWMPLFDFSPTRNINKYKHDEWEEIEKHTDTYTAQGEKAFLNDTLSKSYPGRRLCAKHVCSNNKKKKKVIPIVVVLPLPLATAALATCSSSATHLQNSTHDEERKKERKSQRKTWRRKNEKEQLLLARGKIVYMHLLTQQLRNRGSY